MIASQSLRHARPRRWWIWLGTILAAALCAWLLVDGGSVFGGLATALVAVVMLAVAFGLGWRAWLAACALLLVFYFGASLLLFVPAPLAWTSQPGAGVPAALYPAASEPTLAQLRAQYQLDAVVAGSGSDLARVRRLVHWANGRFAHDATHQPSRPEPLTILAEAAAGQRFRCVEYSIVTAAAAQSLGLPARVVGLKRSDVATARSGGGHVVAEVWLPDLGKWVMADGQWDAVPTAGGTPLSAVEFQRALAERRLDLRVGADALPIKEATYLPWVAPYLYYFDYSLDQRPNAGPELGRLMLGPRGAAQPGAFQGQAITDRIVYVQDPTLFYRAP